MNIQRLKMVTVDGFKYQGSPISGDGQCTRMKTRAQAGWAEMSVAGDL